MSVAYGSDCDYIAPPQASQPLSPLLEPASEPHPPYVRPLSPERSRYGRTIGQLPRQVQILFYKNIVILGRNPVSTLLRLFSCIFFLFLLWIIVGALNSSRDGRSWVKATPHPSAETVKGIQPCITRNCIALAYTPAPSKGFTPSSDLIADSEYPADMPTAEREKLKRVHSIIRSVITKNKGQALPARMVQGYSTAREMEEYMQSNPQVVEAGVIISSPADAPPTFTIQANTTSDEQLNSNIIPLQVAMTAAIMRSAVPPDATFDLEISLQPYAHPRAISTDANTNSADIFPLFIFSALMFPFVMQMCDITTDKETKIRQALRTIGLLDSAYWMSWHLFYLLTSLLTALSMTIFGIIFQFELFMNNDFGVLFFTFFFFSLAMNGLSFFLSSFLHTSAAALWLGVSTFLAGFIVYIVVSAIGIPYGQWPSESNYYMNCSANALFDPTTKQYEPLVSGASTTGKRFVYQPCSAISADNTNYSRQVMTLASGERALPVVLAFFPPVLLSKSLTDLGNMASNDTGAFGLSLANVTSYCAHNTTTGTICDADYSVGNVWGIWFGLYLFFSLLGLYLDNVLPVLTLLAVYEYRTRPEVMEPSTDSDVLKEEALIQSRIGGSMGPENQIEVRGVRKTWKRNGFNFDAVKCPWLGIQKNSLFALLGPNGAGKTTLINMLTGVLPVTAGEALIMNQTVAHPGGMANIQPLLGVCPQFDILWGSLTALEHLRIYAAIKGLPRQSVDDVGMKLLEEVRLRDVAHKQSATFSGGMKRRLSVAMALIGDPQVVFLDEPTTGMDPISRRHVWDVIERIKQDRAVVLTTHSMEEADILGDRIGIMAKGMLRCIGNATHLKAKFGSGNAVVVMLEPNADAAGISEVFRATLGVLPSEETPIFLSFQVAPSLEGKLPQLFAQLEAAKTRLGIASIQIGMSSLEDVFLSIAKSVGAKDGSGGLVDYTVCTGEKVSILVGMAEPFVTAQGNSVRVMWSIDDDGNMTPVNSVLLAKVVTLQVEVPQGHPPGAPVVVMHEGKEVRVPLPPDAAAGAAFATQIQVPVGPADVALGVSSALGGHNSDLEQRVTALSSSYVSQGKAMAQKTFAIQRKRRLANLCMCGCPSVTLAIMFIAQMLIESFLIKDKMASQRCTYCGPTDDRFGKAYCAGMDCFDYFWPVTNADAGRCRPGAKQCLSTMNDGELGAIKQRCQEIASSCGGKGNVACFWPDAAQNNGSLGAACNTFAINPGTMLPEAFSLPKALPLTYAPSNGGLRDKPLVFSTAEAPSRRGQGGGGSVTERVLGRMYADGYTAAEMELSASMTLAAMWTLLMLPGLGCAQVLQTVLPPAVGQNSSKRVSSKITLQAFSPEAQAAACQLLQHGHTTQEPCCLDLSLAGELSETWSDTTGTVTSSGKGKAAARVLLAKLTDEDMSAQYFQALDDLNVTTKLVCVRPAYGILESRLSLTRLDLGLEEGFAVLAQAYNLSEAAVHPKTEKSENIPACSAKASCTTPNARWAQACDLVGGSFASVECGPKSMSLATSTYTPCSDALKLNSTLTVVRGGKGARSPCLCTLRDFLKRFATVEMGVSGRDALTGRKAVVGLPKLPGVTASGMGPHFSTPKMCVVEGVQQCSGPIVWDTTLLASSTDWWNWPMSKRFGDCKCYKEIEGVVDMSVGECKELFGQGCDENNPLKCQRDRDCMCKMHVSSYNLSTSEWTTTRGQSRCSTPSQKDTLVANNAYGGFSLLVRNCATQQTAVGILYKLSNLTGLRFECTSMAWEQVASVYDVDNIIYNGFYKPGARRASTSMVQGVAGAAAFKSVTRQRLDVTLMRNESTAAFPFGRRGREVRVLPGTDRILAPLNALLRSYAAEVLGLDSAMLTGIKAFPSVPSWGMAQDIGSRFGPFFVTLTFLVLLPSIVTTHVQEKVVRIRIMMKMMGLGTSAYWFISYVFWFVIMFTFSMFFMLLVNVCKSSNGYKIGMFQNVTVSIQFVFFLLYSLNIVSFAFFFSTVANSVRIAQVASILFIVISAVLGSVFEGADDIWGSDGVTAGTKTFITLFPSLGFYRAMVTWRSTTSSAVLGNPSIATDKILWSSLTGKDATSEVLIVFAVESVVFLLAALYLDQVWSGAGSYGVSAHPLFCLGFGQEKRRGDGSEASNVDHSVTAEATSTVEATATIGFPADVQTETNRVHQMLKQLENRLNKVYRGGKEAVKCLHLGVRRGECFGMLGPNGAGKTSTINMLVGFTRPTRGFATIEGFNILTQIKKIYSIMGVCPQHDILWETLSPREHLTFYGYLKNLSGEKLAEAIDSALRSVDLLDVIDTPAGTFSGGMKRRLSVAISFIGMPLVCYLDEPSTGLDPANRCLLWDCIKRAKASRTIVLTTHSMEEAEGLCDRLTIFVDGQMQCIGVPKALTMRYGSFYNVTLTTTSVETQSKAAAMIAQLCPTFSMSSQLEKVCLEMVFTQLLQARAQGWLESYGVSSPTLEDAFIKICLSSDPNRERSLD